MVCGRFLLLLPKSSRLQSFFSEKKHSELASSKGWTAARRECQECLEHTHTYTHTQKIAARPEISLGVHTRILLVEALGVHLPQGVEVPESILGLRC